MFGGKIGLPELAVVVFLFLLIAPWAQIFHKAGYSRWLVLLFFVPLAGVVVIVWFAFSKWPVENEVESLRATMARVTTADAKP